MPKDQAVTSRDNAIRTPSLLIHIGRDIFEGQIEGKNKSYYRLYYVG